MLIDTILLFITTIINWFFSLFPTFDGYPQQMTDSVAWLAPKIHAFDCIIPTDDMKIIIGICIPLTLVLIAIRVFAWIAGRRVGKES